jgi:glyoxylase-like metal-dependent hydrolase (beta-lactamase superfamily II)
MRITKDPLADVRGGAPAISSGRVLRRQFFAGSSPSGAVARLIGKSELKGTNGRVVELHVLAGNSHNEQTLVAWLPAEGILFQADMMNPPAPNAQVPPTTPTISSFYDNLQKLKIQPKQIIGGHGNRVATMADLNAVAGKGGTN